MQKYLRSFRPLAVALLVAAVALPSISQAQQDLKVTNVITFATAYTGAPTNAVGTNGVAIGTGHYIDIGGPDKALFTFRGVNSTTNLGNAVFTLVRSDKLNPPSLATDFETTAQITFTVPMNGTNPVVWSTNMDQYAIGAFHWIGVFSVTNTAAAGSITNIVAGGVTNPIATLNWKYGRVTFP